jgi:hypothetical protein
LTATIAPFGPAQVIPGGDALWALPHRALVETFWTPGLVAGDEAVAVARIGVDVECAIAGEATDVLEQEPKARLHPEPQYPYL